LASLDVRRGLAALLALSFLGFPVSGQSTADLVIEDPQGDGTFHAGSLGDQTIPRESGMLIDVKALNVYEDQSGLAFAVDFFPLEAGGRNRAVYVDIGFEHNGQSYVIKAPPPDAGIGGAGLYRMDLAGGLRLVKGVGGDWAQDGTRFNAAVDRNDIYDKAGAAPGIGSRFSNFAVQATGGQATIGPSGPMYAVDALPNPGQTASVYVGKYGLVQQGIARLSSATPVRSSNGEAATFVFPLRAENLGSSDEMFRLVWDELPPGWGVHVSQPVFTIPARGAVDHNLLVTTPFAHQHGVFDSFKVRLLAEDHPDAEGQVVIGIRYHEVPQPAGHHNTLFLHSKALSGFPGSDLVVGGSSYAYMNTLAEDPEDEALTVPADSNFRPITNFTWTVRLTPSLEIGLQSEEGIAKLAIALSSNVPQTEARASAELFVRRPGGGGIENVVLGSGQSAPFAMQPAQEVPIEVPLDMEVLREPYVQGSELWMTVFLATIQPTAVTAQEVPVLLPGGHLELPLLEFRDALPTTQLAQITFEASTPVQRVANPGDVIVYTAALRNGAPQPSAGELSIAGVHSEWAHLVGPATYELDAGAERDVHVVVTIPPDAVASDVSDVVLRATAVNSAEAIARFLTEVDTTNERGDDRELAETLQGQPNARDSPAAGSVVLALGLLGLVAWRRRKAVGP
jgi:hypothetical protein